jgi:hypothetical protein
MKTPLAVGTLVVLAVTLAAVVGARGPGSAADEPVAAEPWSLARSMSQRRSYVAAAELDGLIYAAGGMVGESGRFLDVFQRFDPSANSWTTLPRLPELVRAGAGAALGGAVYVVGGQTPDGPSGRTYAFDVDRGVWEERAPLPEPRFNHALVALDGGIYALGGFAGTTEQDDVFAYDPAADRWTERAPLPRRNHAFGAVAFRGELWTIGGRRGDEILREVWIYDPRADRWRPGPELPKPMELNGTAVAGPEIHTVWESTYQIYDARTGAWRQGPRSLVTRHGLKAFAVSGWLYTVGGCTTDLVDSQVVERRRIS